MSLSGKSVKRQQNLDSVLSFLSVMIPSKIFLTFLLLAVSSSPMTSAIEEHRVEKRQIGVLARTGALPQGKRSVEVLARNGELPPLMGGKKEQSHEHSLDELLDELETAESLSRLRIQALSEKILEQRLEGGSEKRSVAALARNGELPQKRLAEVGIRSGYLIKPPQEVTQAPTDLLDPDDFLAEARSSIADNFFLGNNKRALGPVGNALPWRWEKRNLGSLARDGGLTTLKHPFTRSQRWDDGFDLDDFLREEKKNVGATKNFGKRDLRQNCLEEASQDEDEDGDIQPIEKRFLAGSYLFPQKRGRIPQLGRIHQKVQSPSSRRRPHLRPNWL